MRGFWALRSVPGSPGDLQLGQEALLGSDLGRLPSSVFHTDQDDPSSSDDEGMPYTRPVKFKAAHGFKGPYDFEQVRVVQDLSGEHMVGGGRSRKPGGPAVVVATV